MQYRQNSQQQQPGQVEDQLELSDLKIGWEAWLDLGVKACLNSAVDSAKFPVTVANLEVLVLCKVKNKETIAQYLAEVNKEWTALNDPRTGVPPGPEKAVRFSRFKFSKLMVMIDQQMPEDIEEKL